MSSTVSRGGIKNRGGITVGELLDTAHLGLELLAGSAGVDRAVCWTHVSELEQPQIWLDGGELLISNGIGLRADAEGQAELITGLHAKSAAGLALGVLGPDLHQETLDLADELPFPVLRVPKRIPFLSISHLVADMNEDHARRRMALHIRLLDTARLATELQEVDTLIARLESISGCRIYLVTPAGLPVLPELNLLPGHARARLERIHDEPEHQTYSIDGGYLAPVQWRNRTAAYLVALEKNVADTAGPGAVQHMATIASLLISNVYDQREQDRRQTSELFKELLEGAEVPPAELAVRVSSCGLVGDTLVCAKLGGTTETIDELHHRLCDQGIPHLLSGEQGKAYLVIDAPVEVLERSLEGLELVAGASQEFSPTSAWPLARNQADSAFERAMSGALEPGSLVRYSRADSAMEWLVTDPAVLRGLSQAVLEPITDYDAQHNTALLETLRTYIEGNRRLDTTAKKLYVHKHTVSYRLRRIEELTGRKLTRTEDLGAIWLALKAANASS